MEEFESGQQEMQEKISQATEMVINLMKGKGITDDLGLQRKPTSWKGDIDPSIVLNPNDPSEQEQLRENLPRQSEHINLQLRCNLLDKNLKEIEGVDDLESVDPKELSLVPDLVILPKFKMPKFEKYDGTKCPKTIWPRIVTRWLGTPITKVY